MPVAWSLQYVHVTLVVAVHSGVYTRAMELRVTAMHVPCDCFFHDVPGGELIL